MIETARDGGVFVVTMNAEPNTVNPDFVAALNGVLDEAENAAAKAVVLTGTGKSFNTGLDVPVVMSLQGDDAKTFTRELMRLMHRLLVGPMPVVAAVNGHAFAAGAFLAMACDFRVMRSDRGWICISEVDVGVPIGAPMMGILRAKLASPVAAEAVLTGRRYAGDDALAAGFVDAVATESELLDVAKKRAAELAAKEGGIMATLKKQLWADAAAAFAA